jgi:hypothetical protein
MQLIPGELRSLTRFGRGHSGLKILSPTFQSNCAAYAFANVTRRQLVLYDPSGKCILKENMLRITNWLVRPANHHRRGFGKTPRER